MTHVSRRLGEAVLVAAMFMAPLNEFRPIPGAHPLTWTDTLLPIGFLLLLPWLLRRRFDIPLPYAWGALLLISTVVISSVLGPSPFTSFNYGARLLAATVVIPTAFLWWRPDICRVDVLVWSFVLGHVLSTVWALQQGPGLNGRYDGLTTHVNFFALSGQIAVAFTPYLLARTKPALRWLVVIAGGLCAYSVVMSGSRASLVVLVVLAVVYPLREGSLRAAWAVATGAMLSWLAFPLVFGGLGSGSAFSRLSGDATTTTADAFRHQAFLDAMTELPGRPFLGHGFGANTLWAHDVYLQLAVAGGIFCLAGFLLVLWSLTVPMFGRRPLGRLGYAALSYAMVGLLTPALWDRLCWAGLALCLLAAVPPHDEQPPVEGSPRRAGDLALTA